MCGISFQTASLDIGYYDELEMYIETEGAMNQNDNPK